MCSHGMIASAGTNTMLGTGLARPPAAALGILPKGDAEKDMYLYVFIYIYIDMNAYVYLSLSVSLYRPRMGKGLASI